MPAGAMMSTPQPTTVRRRAVDEGPVYTSETYRDPPRRRNVWPWVLVVVLIMALAGGAYAILSTWSSGEKNQVSAPSVLGLTSQAATAKAKALGVSIDSKGTMPSADYAAGQVARQVPDEGTKLEKGDAIQVWLSSGQGQVTVPDLVGLSVAKAAEKIGNMGLKVNPQNQADSTKPAGTVLRQDPAANTPVNAGSTVTIYVATAANTVTVPILTNMSQDTAVANLTALKLVAQIQQTSSALPSGTVVDQNPKAGQDVQVGSSVTLYVSNNPTPVQVYIPNVTGLSPSDAKARLALYGLSASVTQQETPDHSVGLVFQQTPGAGEKADKGSTVDLLVAIAPASTTTTTELPTTTTTPTTEPTTGSTDTTAF
jgi:serine/threonine-protein kinase